MQPCEHRNKENCELMDRPCYGAKYNSTGEYTIDPWVERACPSYVAVDGESFKPAVPKNAEVIVRIFGPKETDEPCGEDCVVETLELDGEILQNFFNRIYGGKVAVESVDIASEEINKYPEVKRLVEKGAQVIVMINDEVKFIGSIPLPLIKLEIEKLGIERKISPGPSRTRR